MKTFRKHLVIAICGLNDSDLEDALREVRCKIDHGFLNGSDINDTGRYSFAITKRRYSLWEDWFDGRRSIQYLPAECIAECSAPEADASKAVDYWVKKLSFEAPPWLVREYLRGSGAYEPSQLADHQANLRRLLWDWACDCREGGIEISLYLSR